MANSGGEQQLADVDGADIRDLHDRAARLKLAHGALHVQEAEAIYAGYQKALANPELFASGKSLSRGEVRELVERSHRAELAVALRVSENVAARELDRAQLLMEDLPATRDALTAGSLLWESAQVICRTAAILPASSRGELDQRAVELAETMTSTQLRKALTRLREHLHEEPLTARHATARSTRTVWVTPEADGMATLSALLPADEAMCAFNRVNRIAQHLRELDGEERTLAQLRADALSEILTHGDIAGTTPLDDETTPDATFVPGIRAEVRITVPVLTAAGIDDAPADLEGYGPVPADMARRLVSTGSVFYRVLTDPITDVAVSAERLARCAPPKLRLELQLRDQTCRFAGCTRPASGCELDHAIEWRNGGHTAADNLLSLCVSHHHVRHGDRWTYRLHPDGTADWTTPTGRRVTTRPAPSPDSPPKPRFRDSPPPSVWDTSVWDASVLAFEPHVGEAPF